MDKSAKNNVQAKENSLPVDYIEFKNFVIKDQSKEIQEEEDFDQIFINETEKLKY